MTITQRGEDAELQEFSVRAAEDGNGMVTSENTGRGSYKMKPHIIV